MWETQIAGSDEETHVNEKGKRRGLFASRTTTCCGILRTVSQRPGLWNPPGDRHKECRVPSKRVSQGSLPVWQWVPGNGGNDHDVVLQNFSESSHHLLLCLLRSCHVLLGHLHSTPGIRISLGPQRLRNRVAVESSSMSFHVSCGDVVKGCRRQ